MSIFDFHSTRNIQQAHSLTHTHTQTHTDTRRRARRTREEHTFRRIFGTTKNTQYARQSHFNNKQFKHRPFQFPWLMFAWHINGFDAKPFLMAHPSLHKCMWDFLMLFFFSFGQHFLFLFQFFIPKAFFPPSNFVQPKIQSPAMDDRHFVWTIVSIFNCLLHCLHIWIVINSCERVTDTNTHTHTQPLIRRHTDATPKMTEGQVPAYIQHYEIHTTRIYSGSILLQFTEIHIEIYSGWSRRL